MNKLKLTKSILVLLIVFLILSFVHYVLLKNFYVYRVIFIEIIPEQFFAASLTTLIGVVSGAYLAFRIQEKREVNFKQKHYRNCLNKLYFQYSKVLFFIKEYKKIQSEAFRLSENTLLFGVYLRPYRKVSTDIFNIDTDIENCLLLNKGNQENLMKLMGDQILISHLIETLDEFNEYYYGDYKNTALQLVKITSRKDYSGTYADLLLKIPEDNKIQLGSLGSRVLGIISEIEIYFQKHQALLVKNSDSYLDKNLVAALSKLEERFAGS